MDAERVALQLVGDVYEAAHNAPHWEVALTGIANALNGTSTVISVLDPATLTDSVQVIIREDPANVDSYQRYYHRINVHAAEAAKYDAGHVVSGDAILSTQELIKTEFYNDFLRPQDLFHILGCVLAKEKNLHGVFTTYRSKNSEAFGPEEERLVELLYPHLQRACRFGNEMSILKAHGSAAEALDVGVIAISWDASVLSCNAFGSKILEAADGLTLADGMLAVNASPPKVLHNFLQATLALCRRSTLTAPHAIGIARPSGLRSYILRSMPVHNPGGTIRGRNVPAALLFILDPECGLGDIESILQDVFGLSSTEAALAALMASEGDLTQVCEQMHVRKSTARTHLQSVFRKLDVTKQAQLTSKVQQMGRLGRV